jgi:quercetin 2,3-dioxygenase
MIKVRKSEERGHADHGWLNSHHTFSFADYFDPQHMGFRSLRVINEDRVAPRGGFPMHPHRDMEILSYVVKGALAHEDTMGNQKVVGAGEVQRISAGSGLMHSEYNASQKDPVHFLQIWILPEKRGLDPAYADASFASAPGNGLTLAASRDGRAGSVKINQDVDLYVGRMESGTTLSHPLRPGRHGWVQVIDGELDVNGSKLTAGDAAAISEESRLDLKATGPAHALVFDLN